MSFLLIIYFGDKKVETDFLDKSSVQIGANETNDVVVPVLEPNYCFSASMTEDGVSIVSDITFEISGKQVQQGRLTTNDTCVLSRSPVVVAVVYERKKDTSKVVDFSKISVVSIGRNPQNIVCLKNSRVSGSHAKIERQGNVFVLTDLKSTNGTYLNNERVHVANLSNGDAIAIAGYRLVFNNRLLFFRNVGNDLLINLDAETETFPEKEYPYFQKSTRLLYELPSGEFDIQLPPSIGGAPTASILTSLLMPTSIPYHALNQFSRKRKYKKDEKLRFEKLQPIFTRNK